MNKYDLWDMVNVKWSLVKYLIHEIIKTHWDSYDYKIWELWTNTYIYCSEYQLSPLGRPIGFDLSDS